MGVLYYKKSYFCTMDTVFKNKRIVIIAQVWPESNSSAAGKRMLQLLKTFQEWGMDIFMGCAAKRSEFSDDLTAFGVSTFELWLNDQRSDTIFKELNADIVMYDRFMIEEQYGWRVQQQCPDAMTILDTEDLHFLRYARQQMFKDNSTDLNQYLYSERTKRELASIMRCDVCLLISKWEYQLLVDVFAIKASTLFVLPFLEKPLSKLETLNWLNFEQREGFVFIGNFIHEPNYQTVLYIKKHIWPILRKQLKGVKMHIYGAYPTQKVWQLHNIEQGFIIHGRAHDALEVVSKAKVMLAPIVFGAGIKGKFIDAMQVGTPSISSSIGAEAMGDSLSWPGFIADNIHDYIEKSVLLYTDKSVWLEKQAKAAQLLNKEYNAELLCQDFYHWISQVYLELAEHRKNNFLSSVFLHHTALSSKYMGLWIEEKNKGK